MPSEEPSRQKNYALASAVLPEFDLLTFLHQKKILIVFVTA